MSSIIVAIDLGTTKVVCIAGEKIGNGRFRVLAFNEAASIGVRRGQVENIQSVVGVVRPMLEGIRNSLSMDVNEVFVGIAGQHIRYIDICNELPRDDYEREISEDEVKQLEYNIRITSPKNSGEEILHVIPQTYSIDEIHDVTDPVGRLGKCLRGHFHIILGKTESKRHTELCMKRLGLTLKDIILEPIASARAVLDEDDKMLGVAMIDMGGGTTDLIIYYEGIVKHTAVIPFGGNVITEDIKTGCSILARQAEQIKIQHGSCIASLVPENKIITVPGIGGRDAKEISFKTLAGIIEARVEEIMDIVMNEIRNCRLKLGAGIVFTGGASQMVNLREFVTLKTGMPVRIGRPDRISSDSLQEIIHPKYSTAVGLIMYAADLLEGYKKKDKYETFLPVGSTTPPDGPKPPTSPSPGKMILDTLKSFFTVKPDEL
jgi:cell division protein FtsA